MTFQWNRTTNTGVKPASSYLHIYINGQVADVIDIADGETKDYLFDPSKFSTPFSAPAELLAIISTDRATISVGYEGFLRVQLSPIVITLSVSPLTIPYQAILGGMPNPSGTIVSAPEVRISRDRDR